MNSIIFYALRKHVSNVVFPFGERTGEWSNWMSIQAEIAHTALVDILQELIDTGQLSICFPSCRLKISKEQGNG